MTKHPYLVQVREDDPARPGWWRLSRPVLRHLPEAPHPNQGWAVALFPEGAWREAREAQRAWDRSHTQG